MRSTPAVQVQNQPPGPDEPPGPDDTFAIDESEFLYYSQGRRLLRILRLTSAYRALLTEGAHASVTTLNEVLDETAPGDAGLRETGRASILRINGYQTWQRLFGTTEFMDLTLALAFTVSTAGAVVCTTVYARQEDGAPLWASAVFFLVALICSAVALVVAFALRDATLDSTRWVARSVTLGGVVVLAVLGYWLWRLNETWSLPLAGGAVAAMASLAVLGLAWQLRELALAAIYHRSWTACTGDEITETLTSVSSYLREEPWDIGSQANAGNHLQHVARCVEKYLPGYLASDPDLRASTQRECMKIGAGVRDLAVECLLATKETRDRLSARTSELLTLGIQGRWGDWDTGDVDEQPTIPLWRYTLRTMMQVLIGLVPILLLVAGAAYLRREDPESALLSPEVIGPLTLAAFGWFTSFIAGWLRPTGRSASSTDGSGRSPANPRNRT